MSIDISLSEEDIKRILGSWAKDKYNMDINTDNVKFYVEKDYYDPDKVHVRASITTE